MGVEKYKIDVYLYGMAKYFIPYAGDKPASVQIKGHNFIILSQDKETITGYLERIGADCVKKVQGGSRNEQKALLEDLAQSINGGVVIAQADVEVDELLRNLEAQLGWVH